MEDLLAENDFKINEPHNPWKYFGRCCLIAVGVISVLFLVLVLLALVIDLNLALIGVFTMIIPLIVAGYMVFSKKELLSVPFFTVVMGTFLLLCAFFLPLAAIVIYRGDTKNALIVLAIVLSFPMIIMMPVFWFRKKRFIKIINARK